MQNHITALSRSKDVRFDIRIYVTGSDIDDPRIHIVQTVSELLRDAHFATSQLLIFHWGVYHDLYNFIFATLPHQRVICYFHNITPSRLFSDARIRNDIERGEQQIDNLFFPDLIFCNSDFSKSNLVERGLPPERLETLYPVHIIPSSASVARSHAGPAQLLYVGRFVPHKGVRELLLALAESKRASGPPFHLKLIGPKRYSDLPYIDELRGIIASSGLSHDIEFLGEVSDARLSREFSATHALIMPSYHEGFGLPVVEALNAGCFAIAFDGGNLSHLLRDVGVLVPAGDVKALRAAIDDFNARMTSPFAHRRYPLRGEEVSVPVYEAAARQAAAKFIQYDTDRDRFVGKALSLLEFPMEQAASTLRQSGDGLPDLPIAATAATDALIGNLSSRLTRLETVFLHRRRWLNATDQLIQSAASSAASHPSSHPRCDEPLSGKKRR